MAIFKTKTSLRGIIKKQQSIIDRSFKKIDTLIEMVEKLQENRNDLIKMIEDSQSQTDRLLKIIEEIRGDKK